MRIEAKQLVNIIIGLVFLGLVFWLVFYFSSRRQAPVPVPDGSPATYTEADRQKLLQSLRSTDPKPVTPAQREQMLKSLRSSAETKPSTVTERQQVLNSLKAK